MSDQLTGFQELYQRYSDDVYRFAFWLCGDADDAKDITSETFVRVWTAQNKLVLKTVKGYLFTIARNLYLQGLRKQRRKAVLDEKLIDPAPLAEALNEQRSEINQLRRNLQQLPETDRTILILRSVEGLSHQEIANMLGITVNLVKVKIHRARIKLASLSEIKEEKPS